MHTIPAYAKLNLSLEVLGRRDDGFHALISILQTISLADELVLSPSSWLEVEIDAPELEPERNLVTRAARLAIERWAAPPVKAVLIKRIPIAAGLGGGSSDAASTLLGLVDTYALPATCEDLVAAAASLGSDVAFFLYGGTALVEGRGERVTSLPAPPVSWYVLANPGIPVSTVRVFAALTPQDWSSGEVTTAMADSLRQEKLPCVGRNDLQQPLFRLYPQVHACLLEVEEVTGAPALVSGSGATCFARVEDQAAAERAAGLLRARGYWSAAAQSVTGPAVPSPCVA